MKEYSYFIIKINNYIGEIEYMERLEKRYKKLIDRNGGEHE